MTRGDLPGEPSPVQGYWVDGYPWMSGLAGGITIGRQLSWQGMLRGGFFARLPKPHVLRLPSRTRETSPLVGGSSRAPIGQIGPLVRSTARRYGKPFTPFTRCTLASSGSGCREVGPGGTIGGRWGGVAPKFTSPLASPRDSVPEVPLGSASRMPAFGMQRKSHDLRRQPLSFLTEVSRRTGRRQPDQVRLSDVERQSAIQANEPAVEKGALPRISCPHRAPEVVVAPGALAAPIW